MEFLRELFGDKTMTFEQLQTAAQGKEMQVVNAAGGEYVPKSDIIALNDQIEALTVQLGAANEKLEGYDPEWKAHADAANEKLEGYDPEWKAHADAATKKLETQRNEFLIEKALSGAKAKNVTAVKALLDREKLSFNGGEVLGLDKQLAALKKDEGTAFLFQSEESHKSTGLSHEHGSEGGTDKKEEANAALRTLFGKGGN